MRDRLYRLFRKIALLGPTEEEADRINREDREANTQWILGGRVGIVHGVMEYGYRVDFSRVKPFVCTFEGCGCRKMDVEEVDE